MGPQGHGGLGEEAEDVGVRAASLALQPCQPGRGMNGREVDIRSRLIRVGVVKTIGWKGEEKGAIASASQCTVHESLMQRKVYLVNQVHTIANFMVT